MGPQIVDGPDYLDLLCARNFELRPELEKPQRWPSGKAKNLLWPTQVPNVPTLKHQTTASKLLNFSPLLFHPFIKKEGNWIVLFCFPVLEMPISSRFTCIGDPNLVIRNGILSTNALQSDSLPLLVTAFNGIVGKVELAANRVGKPSFRTATNWGGQNLQLHLVPCHWGYLLIPLHDSQIMAQDTMVTNCVVLESSPMQKLL